MRSRRVFQVLCAVGAICMTTMMASGATLDVSVGPGFNFTPADLTIQLGDTVRWTWAGGFHNVESGVSGAHDGNFRSGNPTSANGTIFEFTFDQAFLDANPMPGNVYPYYCVVHEGVGMIASLTIDEPLCPADITDSGAKNMPDGAVDVFDLLELLANWATNGPGANIADPPNDFVDVFDLLDLLAAWGDC